MNAATGSFRFQSVLFGAVLGLVLAACHPANPGAMAKRVEATWAERQLLFVADPSLGTVRVFHLRAAPQLIAELRAPGRSEVRDIAIDAGRGRIWVLGDGAVYLHDARSFSLVKRFPGVGANAGRLALSPGGTSTVFDTAGAALLTIDPATLIAASPRDSSPQRRARPG